MEEVTGTAVGGGGWLPLLRLQGKQRNSEQSAGSAARPPGSVRGCVSEAPPPTPPPRAWRGAWGRRAPPAPSSVIGHRSSAKGSL